MPRILSAAVFATILSAAGWAAEGAAATTPPPAKPYPLDTCIVSGEKLDSMGGAVAKVHDGQEVKFCCKGCIKAFDKDPAPYMKKIAAAAAKAGSATAPAAAGKGHAGHAH